MPNTVGEKHTGSERNANGLPTELIKLHQQEREKNVFKAIGLYEYDDLILGIGGPSTGQGIFDTLSIEIRQVETMSQEKSIEKELTM